MLRLAKNDETVKVVSDQKGSPTYTRDLSVLLCDMITTNKFGIYNASNEGVCTWAEFASEIFSLSGEDVKIIPVTTEEYSTPATRQKNSVMSKRSLDEAGFGRLPHWKDALKRYLADELSEKTVQTV